MVHYDTATIIIMVAGITVMLAAALISKYAQKHQPDADKEKHLRDESAGESSQVHSSRDNGASTAETVETSHGE
jgi:hypothetical protein